VGGAGEAGRAGERTSGHGTRVDMLDERLRPLAPCRGLEIVAAQWHSGTVARCIM
jgi:hypothetical protein